MDNEAVAGQIELLDERELVLELRAYTRREWRAVAGTASAPGQVSEIGGLGFAGGDGVVGEAITEVLQAERATLGDLARRANPFGPIGETFGHFVGCAQV